MSVVYHSAPNINNNNIHDTIPLDTSSNITQISAALPYITQPLIRLYTWKSPGDISRNQIDYIMINQKFKNCVKQARTYPVTFKFNVKLKKIKSNHAQSLIDYSLLKDDTYKGDITYKLKTTMICWDW